MSTSETTYSFRTRVPTILERGRDQVSQLEAYLSGSLVAPSSGTYSLISPSGTAVVDAQAVTITGSVATYTLSGTTEIPTTLALGALYQERWSLVMPDGSTRTERRSAAIALFELHPPIADVDFTSDYPGLLDDLGDYATSLQSWIDSAWGTAVRYLTKHQDFPYMLVEPSDVFEWVYHEVLYRVFRTLFKGTQGGDERWRVLMDEHKDRAAAERSSLRILPDRDQDGLADSHARKSAGVRTIQPNALPVADPRSLPARFR